MAESTQNTQKALFDWDSLSKHEGFGSSYSNEEKTKMLAMYDSTSHKLNERQVVQGQIVSVTGRDVVVNIGFKSDGLVPLNEFRDVSSVKPGDKVEVYIQNQEDKKGQLILSRRKAKIVRAWEKIEMAFEQGEVIEGVIKRRTKGGLIADIFAIEAFLPGSQIDVKPIRDFDIFVGKKMELKVIKINYANDNVVVSHKVLIEKDLELQRAEILNNLERGQVLEGVIKNMTNFGVFIDLGGVDGLLHITDISWGRISHPEQLLQLDQRINVVVLDFDDGKKRISLGMKQLTPHPWESLDPAIDIGTRIKGKIVNVADYGAFLEIKPGVEGLIHVSEMSWSQHLRNPQDFLSIDDEMKAVVLTIEREERKMSLGIKQLTEDPWTKEDILHKYAVGTRHKGIVRNLTIFGLFIELEEGIDGLVHVSDLSWTKKIKHPSEFIKVGEELEVQVLELDKNQRRLALGHKQLEENPWDAFEEVFKVNSLHKCTVVNKIEKGAILELPYGIEGFCQNRNLKKEDGSFPEVGDSLDFKVVEFSKDERRIILSHSHLYRGKKNSPKTSKGGSEVKENEAKDIEKTNKENTEKATFAELEAFSELKEKSALLKKATPKKASIKKTVKVVGIEEEKQELQVQEKSTETQEDKDKK